MHYKTGKALLLCVLANYFFISNAIADNGVDLRDWDYQYSVKYIIDEIKVVGNNLTDPEVIIAYSGLQVGDAVQLPSQVISEAIKKIWKQNLVKDIYITATLVSTDHVVLNIHIKEIPHLSKYIFEGIKKRENGSLAEKVELVVGKALTDEIVKSTVEKVRKYWIDEGYTNVEVSADIIPDPDKQNHVQFIIKINKGKKMAVRKIVFAGNENVDAETLRFQMVEIKEKARFTLIKDILKKIITLKPVMPGGVLWRPFDWEDVKMYLREHVIFLSSRLDKDKLGEDKQKVIELYRSKGFRDAKIINTEFKNCDDRYFDIIMHIDEGAKYTIGNIKWIGNYIHNQITLAKILGMKQGGVYNSTLLKERLTSIQAERNIASLYSNNGYLMYRAIPVETSIKNNSVDLEIRINEGEQFYINENIISGNKITHDNIILRELKTLPGDKFSGAKLVRSYRELTMLNLFAPELPIEPIPNEEDKTVDMKYTIKENTKFQFMASGAMGGGPPRIIAQIYLNNASLKDIFRKRIPLGANQTVSLSTELGSEYQAYGIKFIDPCISEKYPIQIHWAGDLSRSLTYDTVDSKNKLADKKPTGVVWSIGTTMGIAYRLGIIDYTSMMWNLNLHGREYDKINSIIDENNKVSGVLKDFSLEVSITRDSTDNPIFPKEGSKVKLAITSTPPWTYFKFNPQNRGNKKVEITSYKFKEYCNLLVDTSYYIKLISDLVLCPIANFGIVGKLPGQLTVGPFERFFLGGTMSSHWSILGKEHVRLRGYNDDSLTPTDKVSGYEGGLVYEKVALELRYPILASSILHIYMLGFAEAGQTWSKYKEFNLFNLKKSAGVGVRFYVSFLGASVIGIDFGYGFDKSYKQIEDEGDEMIVHFSVGVGGH